MIKLNAVSGGGGLSKLAEDLTFPSSLSNNNGYTTIALNPQGSLTTALSLTGKYAISALRFDNMTAETVTVKLTVDGDVVWNDTFSLGGTSLRLLGFTGVDATAKNEIPFSVFCGASLLLELETLTDTVVTFYYSARPIL
jgi:hypothetical protein